MQEKRYWQTLEDYNNVSSEAKEFNEELPVVDSITESISTESTGRRDFLKQLGFSIGAATIAASCEMPIKKSIPYVFKPEEVTPGVANYYASAYTYAGEYVPVLVKTREGRPIKLEGNKNSVVSKGGTTAQAQASVVSLYDNARFKSPFINKKAASWKEVDAAIAEQLPLGKVAIVSSSIISPSTQSAINEFKAKFNAAHIIHDAISYSGLVEATEQCLGSRGVPNYQFGMADLIVSVGADFAASWINPTEYAADYSVRRKVNKNSVDMSRHIHIESIPSATSATSDKRYAVSPSQEAMAIVDLYTILSGGGKSSIPGVNETANELIAAKSRGLKSLVVCGVNDVNIQTLTLAINQLLGNIGTTINGVANYKRGVDKEMEALMAEMNNGDIKSLIFIETNPVYSYKGFDAAIKKVKNTIFTGTKNNETADVCRFICPSHHALESWNDAEPKPGIYATCQPTIAPLFDTRQYQETLLSWAGNSTNFYDYIKNYVKANKSGFAGEYGSFDSFWDNLIQLSEVSAATTPVSAFNGAGVATAAAAAASSFKKSDLEIKFYSSVHGDGSFGDNPFIQELPDPVTRITWGNYAVVNPNWAKKNNIEPDMNMKDFYVIKLTVNGKEVSIPAYSLPGVPENTIGIKMGFGRTKTGNEQYERGVNVFQLMDHAVNISSNVKYNGSNGTEKLAAMQTYFTIKHKGLGGEKVRDVIKATSLSEYKKNPEAGNLIGGKPRKEWLEHHLVTMYGAHQMPGHQWGMVVDLNSCVGCGACVVACNIENNVPVVGQDQVIRSREMHWMRIDRYYTGDMNNPEVTFQPMMCQHCDNAPCENVCPVSATNHSSEGLNQMAYNRCIGTRYCANNCPYKVRRFNWYDYSASDSFNKENLGFDNYDDTLNQHNSLARMVLNPDVTTRSRGVIEKCSFCVQRIQAGKLEAKKENRQLNDGDIVSACQNACPTHAITFGDVNNKETKVHQLTMDERAFGVLEEIHTLPSVSYLTRVTNNEEIKA